MYVLYNSAGTITKTVSPCSSIRIPSIPRQAARQLLTLDTKDPKRLFEGPALLRRMTRFGLLGEDEKELDFVLQLTTEKMLERRLQTKVRCSSTIRFLLSAIWLGWTDLVFWVLRAFELSVCGLIFGLLSWFGATFVVFLGVLVSVG